MYLQSNIDVLVVRRIVSKSFIKLILCCFFQAGAGPAGLVTALAVIIFLASRNLLTTGY
jgi:hypothetical protein